MSGSLQDMSMSLQDMSYCEFAGYVGLSWTTYCDSLQQIREKNTLLIILQICNDVHPNVLFLNKNFMHELLDCARKISFYHNGTKHRTKVK